MKEQWQNALRKKTKSNDKQKIKKKDNTQKYNLTGPILQQSALKDLELNGQV